MDYQILSADPNLNHALPAVGSVIMAAGATSVDIAAPLSEVDTLFEGTETLTLELVGLIDPVTATPVPATIAMLDPDFMIATGEVEDDDPQPHLFLHSVTSPCSVTEGGSVAFEARLRDPNNPSVPAASASTVEVDFVTSDGTATAGTGPPDDYIAVSVRLSLASGVTAVNTLPVTPAVPLEVETLDDTAAPVGEPTETFNVALLNPSGAPLSSVSADTAVDCDIEDDEVRVTVADVAVEEGNQLTFSLSLDRDPSADIAVDYQLVDYNAALVDPSAAPIPLCGARRPPAPREPRETTTSRSPAPR